MKGPGSDEGRNPNACPSPSRSAHPPSTVDAFWLPLTPTMHTLAPPFPPPLIQDQKHASHEPGAAPHGCPARSILPPLREGEVQEPGRESRIESGERQWGSQLAGWRWARRPNSECACTHRCPCREGEEQKEKGCARVARDNAVPPSMPVQVGKRPGKSTVSGKHIRERCKHPTDPSSMAKVVPGYARPPPPPPAPSPP